MVFWRDSVPEGVLREPFHSPDIPLGKSRPAVSNRVGEDRRVDAVGPRPSARKDLSALASFMPGRPMGELLRVAEQA